MRRGIGAREDAAERMILRGPPGWQDAFRTRHGNEDSGRSWKARVGSNPGYRLDHILHSSHMSAVECAYDHDVRRDGLSYYSAMYATLALSTAPATL